MIESFVTFGFNPPPRGDFPKWAWKVSLMAQVDMSGLVSLSGNESPDDIAWLMEQNRSVLIEAARRRLLEFSSPPKGPILLQPRDLVLPQ